MIGLIFFGFRKLIIIPRLFMYIQKILP